jgi:hypothetical protein
MQFPPPSKPSIVNVAFHNLEDESFSWKEESKK